MLRPYKYHASHHAGGSERHPTANINTTIGQAWEPARTSRITTTPPPGTCNVPLRSKPPHPATTGGHGSPPVHSDQSPVAGHRRPTTFDVATIIAYNASGLQ